MDRQASAIVQGSAHGLNFFAVCYGLRLANLQEFPRPQPRSFPSNYFGLGQFLHSLDVNPCTPHLNSPYAEKILMAVRKTLRDVTRKVISLAHGMENGMRNRSGDATETFGEGRVWDGGVRD